MIEFYINGQQVDVQLEDEQSIGDVLKSFEKTCEENEAAVIGITVNGKQITAELFDEESAKPLEKNTKFEFSIVTKNDIKESFSKLSELFSELSSQMENLPVALQSGKNLEVSESERPLSIGGTDLIDCNIFDNFDYVALGHLHGRQKVGREEVRYSGSLLKYSFSEVNQKKGVTIFEIDEDKNVNIDLKELTPLRDLRIIKGNIDELIENGRNITEGKEDYIQAVLLDDGELINPIEKLRAVYPNTMLITRENKRQYDENNTSAKNGYKNKSEKDLFEEFYNSLSDGEFTEEKSKVIDEIINEVLKGEI